MIEGDAEDRSSLASIRPSATAKKSFSIRKLADLRLPSFPLGPAPLRFSPPAANPSAALPSSCAFPSRDLVRVHVEAFGKLGERLVVVDGSPGDLRLAQRCMGTAGSFHCICSYADLSPH